MVFNKSNSFTIGKTYCKYYLYDTSKPLIITFAPAGALVKEDELNNDISIWGYDFIKKKQMNIIAFAAIESNNWYLDSKLYNFLEDLQKKISIFKYRYGYGVSMGGYAVSAYANILKLQKILLYSPISTLNENILTFDKRHKIEKNLWINNSLDGSKCDVEGYIIYDPFCVEDRKHAERYNNKLKHLKVPGLGHMVIKYIAKLGLAPWIFDNFIKDTLEKKLFIEKVKRRRELSDYYNNMIQLNHIKGNFTRIKILEEYKRKNLTQKDLEKYNDINAIHIDALRDLAVYFEDKDIKKSFLLMQLAHELRPKGPFIKKKYLEYKQLITEGKNDK